MIMSNITKFVVDVHNLIQNVNNLFTFCKEKVLNERSQEKHTSETQKDNFLRFGNGEKDPDANKEQNDHKGVKKEPKHCQFPYWEWDEPVHNILG